MQSVKPHFAAKLEGKVREGGERYCQCFFFLKENDPKFVIVYEKFVEGRRAIYLWLILGEL